MRIWSIHPKYLDTKGLVALWREALLARKVLMNGTLGYRNHPQLIRFKEAASPLNAINCYLQSVYYEAEKRGYKFDKEKINWTSTHACLRVSNDQLNYERLHLVSKVFLRSPSHWKELEKVQIIQAHPLFVIVSGKIEAWEIQKKKL